ncbi:hypothetical protein ACFL96_20335 [Thermoproteota archaeon]
MSFEQYWIGKNIDLENTWKNYESGNGYIQKFQSMETYFLELVFDKPNTQEPLFNQEAIYKTVKSSFHDVKKLYLPENYNTLGPIFLYEIRRGSSKYSFLAEFLPIATWVTKFLEIPLAALKAWNLIEDSLNKRVQRKGLKLDNTKKRLDLAKEKLYLQGLSQVRLSKSSFNGNAEDSRQNSIDLIK